MWLIYRPWKQDGKAILVSKRDIVKGDEVTLTYGIHHHNMAKEKRLVTLKMGYKFDCECLACANDYPTLNNLSKSLGQSKDQLEQTASFSIVLLYPWSIIFTQVEKAWGRNWKSFWINTNSHSPMGVYLMPKMRAINTWGVSPIQESNIRMQTLRLGPLLWTAAGGASYQPIKCNLRLCEICRS